ncbi:MAG: T9SS type A sorting domain-containing protein [Crocinitomicaceae bacterium]|nr:T9SS type A sorting domain-containing protein [Flavobacteriales bacterium]NQZ37682.1 T9SS type A sorting domain-containing protein [Crocinitomicaceae bacterium]
MKTFFSLSSFLFAFSLSTMGQSFVNGDLEGTVDFLNPTAEPNGWVEVAYTESYCQATASGWDSPDITGPNGPISNLGISGIPYSGQTFVSGLLGMGGTEIWHEGIQQTVSDFVPFARYRISFYQANVKQVSASTFMATDESGAWAVYVDGNLLTTTASTTSTLAFDDINLDWEYREFIFTPTDTVHTFGFLPADDDASIEGATGEALRMGIDNISITVLAVGIDELFTDPVTIYPNPATSFVTIDLRNEVDLDVELINAQGQVVLSKEFTAGQERRIELEGESGLYFVKVRLNDEWKFYKVVKK